MPPETGVCALLPARPSAAPAPRAHTIEVATLRSQPAAERPRAFLRCWTRKEAFIKARGDGLSLPLHDFDVEFAPGRVPALLRTAWSTDEPSEWTIHDLSDLFDGAIAAL